MKKIEKTAINDAYDWAASQLLENDIIWKQEHLPGYKESYWKALEKVDLSDEAEFLIKQRIKLERILLKPNRKPALIGGVLLVAGIVYLTGYDKVLLEKGQQRVRRVRLWTTDFANKGETYDKLVDKGAEKIKQFVDGDNTPAKHSAAPELGYDEPTYNDPTPNADQD